MGPFRGLHLRESDLRSYVSFLAGPRPRLRGFHASRDPLLERLLPDHVQRVLMLVDAAEAQPEQNAADERKAGE